MRKNNSIQFTTIIILISIITVLMEFLLLHFLHSPRMICIISSLILILFTHEFLVHSFNYEANFVYTLMCVFLSSLIIVIDSMNPTKQITVHQTTQLVLLLANFFVPTIYCVARCLFDSNGRYVGFLPYYRNNTIMFFVLFLIVFVSNQFLQYSSIFHGSWIKLPFIQSVATPPLPTLHCIPFLSLATHIEDYIYGIFSLQLLVHYIVTPILLYIPLGFIISFLLRYHHRVIRLLCFIILPVLIEIIQYNILHISFEIDDIILAILGQLIGALIFFILNALFLHIKDEDFLENNRYGRQSSLHF